MYGVMMPGVSAGSNQVGAIDTWTAQVSYPSGAAGADVGPSDPRSNSATTRGNATRRVMESLLCIANVTGASRGMTLERRRLSPDVRTCQYDRRGNPR